MTITVRLFSVVRERAGISQVALTLPELATVAVARDALLERFPALRALTAGTAFAVNLSYTSLETQLHEGDELALIPPVSGG
ncbi:MAG TPA: MoaD/ThiS family protein [Tepidisphaeraceae bacterium]|nr:MoaD/ThiS family protein [Tepidisphaeraceae bacterium]